MNEPRLRRRTLAALLAASGTAVLAAGCGPSPVPTSPDVAHDPLAELDPATWGARSAEEMRALPVQGEAQEMSTWSELGGKDSTLDPVRDMVMTYVEAAYLSPVELRGLDDETAYDRVSGAAPMYWADALREAWENGGRPFYAFALAEPFRTAGRPAICADWFRAERDDGPALAVGTTLAWTVLDTSTRRVGVVAYRIEIVIDLDAEGGATGGDLRLTLHGLDGCAMAEQGGLVVPALAADERHLAVQEATLELVLGAPRIPLEQLLDEDPPPLTEDEETYLGCD